MWGRDEIGLFNSLYRNMQMQDNDSLIACHYGTYWKPNSSSVTETTGWYTKMQVGTNPTVPVDKHPFKKENEDRCLTSVIINILMMLSEPLWIYIFLLFVGISAQVIDENSVKMLNF